MINHTSPFLIWRLFDWFYLIGLDWYKNNLVNLDNRFTGSIWSHQNFIWKTFTTLNFNRIDFINWLVAFLCNCSLVLSVWSPLLLDNLSLLNCFDEYLWSHMYSRIESVILFKYNMIHGLSIYYVEPLIIFEYNKIKISKIHDFFYEQKLTTLSIWKKKMKIKWNIFFSLFMPIFWVKIFILPSSLWSIPN